MADERFRWRQETRLLALPRKPASASEQPRALRGGELAGAPAVGPPGREHFGRTAFAAGRPRTRPGDSALDHQPLLARKPGGDVGHVGLGEGLHLGGHDGVLALAGLVVLEGPH